MHRGIKRALRNRSKVNPLSRPISVFADMTKASTRDIQDIRDNVANLIMEKQVDWVKSLLPLIDEGAVFEITCDEAEMKVSRAHWLPHLLCGEELKKKFHAR